MISNGPQWILYITCNTSSQTLKAFRRTVEDATTHDHRRSTFFLHKIVHPHSWTHDHLEKCSGLMLNLKGSNMIKSHSHPPCSKGQVSVRTHFFMTARNWPIGCWHKLQLTRMTTVPIFKFWHCWNSLMMGDRHFDSKIYLPYLVWLLDSMACLRKPSAFFGAALDIHRQSAAVWHNHCVFHGVMLSIDRLRPSKKWMLNHPMFISFSGVSTY